jgi:CHASE2 domain-containing sensor protein
MPEITELLRETHAAQASGDRDRMDSALGALHNQLRAALPEDPLVAASCLAVVSLEDIRAELEPIARAVQSRHASAIALVTTPEGRGELVEILVDLAPGNSGVWCPHALSRDAELAAQLAAAVALGGELNRWGVRWQLKGEAVESATRLRGSSLGLAMAVAVRAAQQGQAGPSGWAFTGGLDLNGQVVSVAGIPAKIRAAEAAGILHVALPAGDRAGLTQPQSMTLVPTGQFEALCQRLWPVEGQTKGRGIPWRWALLLLPVLVAWTALLDGAELLVRGPLMRGLLGELPAENVLVMGLPQGDRKEARWDYPDILDGLVQAGATAIGFDVLFLAESDADGSFSAAIDRAESAGVEVILPRRFDGQDFLELSTGLAQSGHSAMVVLEQDLLFGSVRRLPLRLTDRDGRQEWALSVALLAGHLGADPPFFQGQSLAVGVTRNESHAQRMWLPPVARAPRMDWGGDLSGARGKAVLIGALDGHADALRTPSGLRYGVEIHAAATESLARQKGLRGASPLSEALLALFVGLFTALGAKRLGPRRRRWALGLGAGTVVILIGALKAGVVFALSPVILASFLGVFVGGRT